MTACRPTVHYKFGQSTLYPPIYQPLEGVYLPTLSPNEDWARVVDCNVKMAVQGGL